MKGEIRKVAISELSVIQDLAYRIWPSAFKNILTTEQIEYMLDWMYNPSTLSEQLNEGHHFFIIEFEGEPVGFIGIAGDKLTNRLKIHKLYVLPSLHGSGFGKQLFQFAKEWAIQHKYKAVYLNVNRFNKAFDFYKSQGMSVLFEENIAIGKGYWMEDYVMEKSIEY